MIFLFGEIPTTSFCKLIGISRTKKIGIRIKGSIKRFSEKQKKKIFDINNPKLPSISIQPNTLIYNKVDNKKIKFYEENLYLFLKEKIENARLNNQKIKITENYFRPFQTKWNRKISTEIKNNMLFLLESFKYRVKEVSAEEVKNNEFIQQSLIDLKNFKTKISNFIESNKFLYGIPFNFQFQQYESIWEEIQDTEIPQVFSDDADFLLSVKVFPYPNNFCSVWVFLGYLINK